MLFERYAKRGVDFLGVKYPLIAGGMTWVSNFELCKAVSDNGAFPVLAGRNMPPEIFEKERTNLQNIIKKRLHYCYFFRGDASFLPFNK